MLLSLLVIVMAIVAALVPLEPATVERLYSTGAYPPLQSWLTSISNLLPFALMDPLLVAVVAGVMFVLGRAASATFKRRSPIPLAKAIFRLATIGAGAYLIFLALWGFNYRRTPMTSRLELRPGQAQTEGAVALGLDAVRELNGLHAEAHQLGWIESEWKDAALIAAAGRVQSHLTGVPAPVPGRLKLSLLGPWFRWSSIDGMVNPFGLEVIENPDLLPFERPFVAAHEWAHLAGFADESEANFVGFLTCVNASVPARYSGWLFLYWQIAGETDSRGRARLWDAMAPGPRQDVRAITDRVRRGEMPRLRLASWRVYDQYLKANRVEAGVRSYGAVVNLLIRARFDPEWTPILKR